MNNSIVKLEDFELDEISGGININKEKAKQVAKKTTGYAIKGLCTAVFGSVGFVLSGLLADKFKYFDSLKKFLEEKLDKDLAGFLTFDICFEISTAFAGVAGWSFGSWICKKLGLED